MGNKMLQDAKGNTSSKRVWGSVFLGCSLGLLIAIGTTSIFRTISDPDTALESGKYIAGIGATLLIGGVVEHFTGKPKGGDE